MAVVNSASEVMANIVEEGSGQKEAAIPRDQVDVVDDMDYVWGAKGVGNNFKTVSIRGEEYSLNDCVHCRSEGEVEHVGKIMKLLQKEKKKVCIVRWFFRLSELPASVKGLDHTPDVKELFLASGEVKGVENENLLVSSNKSSTRGIHNVENELPLEMITGKCRVLCTAVDDDNFNEIPTSQQKQAADYFFSNAFDCDSLEITTLDGLVDAIGVQRVFNKKEWLIDKSSGRSSSQISSPRRHCQSSGSGSLPVGKAKYLPTTSVKKVPEVLNLEKSRLLKARKRRRDKMDPVTSKVDSLEAEMINESPNSKKTKVSGKNSLSLSEQGEEQNESVHESRRGMGLTSNAQLQFKGKHGHESPLAIDGLPTSKSKNRMEELGNAGKHGALKNPLSTKNVVETKQVTKREESADQLRNKTNPSSGVPRQRPPKFLEMSESSAGKVNLSVVQKQAEKMKNANSRHEAGHSNVGTNRSEEFHVPKNTSGASTQRKAGEGTLLTKKPHVEKIKRPPLVSPSTTKKRGITDAEREKELPEQRLLKSLPTSGPQGLEKIARQGQTHKSKEHSTAERVTYEPESAVTNDKDAHVMDMEHTSEIPREERDAHQASRGLIFKPKAEVWEDSIDRAVKARRVLLLKNVDPEVHSTDLEKCLSEFLKTKCEVRKSPPPSFYYYDTAEALLKLPTPRKAEEILRTLEDSCLVLGDRPVIATLFETSQKQPSKFPGHLDIQQKRDQERDDYKNAVATSHGAQGNTIEFAFGLPWRLLQEQHDMQWKLLREAHSKELKLLKAESAKLKKHSHESKVSRY